ncbi:hypothetical protein EV182_000669 [Spiromyces aspiralis]|uniref:Uncharacterized protein n=1 Tax=Spiromyces aspiralis TaxID=68401 RepID=A0ACC1HUK8_9FUNG|nr:hypothetical protein EV182_000669 [Spiromyces aspiralis]
MGIPDIIDRYSVRQTQRGVWFKAKLRENASIESSWVKFFRYIRIYIMNAMWSAWNRGIMIIEYILCILYTICAMIIKCILRILYTICTMTINCMLQILYIIYAMVYSLLNS